ncbi:MAG: anaerobic glycerol-3-phosphate dehydrogenase subunit A [Clostridiales bacterium]|nr:anaerobic glycerol-3-phosphate dehydrogenase subunit A [Clostridiales bacterium]
MDNYDVIIIGGGATGAGTARDCALRGLSVLLVERFDFTAGATGRNHGLLHSGARYAVTDRESATECIRENMTLRSIARHCVEDTGGLFITLPDDDLQYQTTFVNSCIAAGINAEIIDPQQARLIEPSVNPSLIGAVKVPDGAIDPFRLTTANIIDATRHGAKVLTYHEVISFLRDAAGAVVGVQLRDNNSGNLSKAYARIVINAAGIWGHHIASLADINVNMFPAKGALLIFGHRINNMVINRCRKPANADILVPGDTICLIGTTSDRVPYDTIDNMEVTPREVDILMSEGAKLAPSLASTRILRAYAGVRPLVASDDDPSGRSISRGIVCLDHSQRDGVDGLITITGGKLMTYRLMAEWATDMACRKLNIDKKCETAVKPLPGSEPSEVRKQRRLKGWRRHKSHIIELSTDQKAAQGRHGTESNKIDRKNPADDALVCECEQVSVAEINYAIDDLHVHNLLNLRRRTRLGMGTCQGQLCACRATGLLAERQYSATTDNDPKAAAKYNSHSIDKNIALDCTTERLQDLKSFINERWKGMSPVIWGETIEEAQFMAWLYQGVAAL